MVYALLWAASLVAGGQGESVCPVTLEEASYRARRSRAPQPAAEVGFWSVAATLRFVRVVCTRTY
jgi:hypothetical protein